MKKIILIATFTALATVAFGQKIRVTSGTLAPIAGEKELGVVFTYDNMQVGKLREADYIARKVEEYNKKEPGRGDEWNRAWVADRKDRFEPQFLELFDKYMSGSAKNGGFALVGEDTHPYTMHINTYFTEPGFNIGIMRQNASITLDVEITSNASGENICRILVENASANSFSGMDFDTGYRIQECYGKAGRELAKFFVKSLKL